MCNEPNEDFGWDANDENGFDDICESGNYYDNDDDFNLGHEFDEGSDRDNWEEEQVFQDGHDY